ncbi:MAG: hypothetical protein ABI321_19440 [Polyangia bacterium]
MRIQAVASLLCLAAVSFCARPALADALNFTNSAAQLNDIAPLRDDVPNTIRFEAGSAVWGVFSVASAIGNIGNFARGHVAVNPGDKNMLHITFSMLNKSRVYKEVYTTNLTLTDEEASRDFLIIPIIPDHYDPNATGLNDILDRLPDLQNGETTVKYRIDSSQNPDFFAQNGFILDLSKGLGRYAEWEVQRAAYEKHAHSAYEAQHRSARSAFVKSYRSQRVDPKFTADVKTWWKAHNSSVPLAVKACSAEFILLRDRFGDVMEKQLCGLVTFRAEKKCYVMMRRFTYRGLGHGHFDTSLADSTYDTMSFDSDGEKLAGGAPYEIECGAAGR